MTWDEIATVAAVVRTKSLLSAAKELGIRHSSVSRRIAAIETQLGEPLFLRGRRLTPTALAREIESHAGAMAIAARHLDTALSARRAKRGAEVVITTSDALAPLLLRALARGADDTKVRLVVTDEELELEPGAVDMALRPTGAPRRSLRGRRLGTLAVGVYQRKTPRLRRGSWILPSDAMRKRMSMRWLREVPEAADSVVECDNLLAMRDACLAGLGRCVLPAFLVLDDPRIEQVAVVEEGTPIWLFVPATTQVEGTQRPFVDALARELKAERGAWR
jgi:DNA-binding transcriptional LysR family regulator